MKHLSNRRKRKQISDSVSSGERKRNSLNREDLSSRGCGTLMWEVESELNHLESWAIDRDSRVHESLKPPRGIPSNAVHVKLCMNPSRPLDKAKYSLATDSELVPRGKGEKNRC